ncbi:MAG: PIN domain-containing protein [Chloroflexi bacterium]|nr:PIN domain-containing protein [Chloroflexota bacterium]
MTTGAARLSFVDTNVLVYASVVEAPLHAVALEAIRVHERAGQTLWISRQVLREFLATLSRPQTFAAPLAPAVLTAQVRDFETRFHVIEDGPAVTARLLTLLEQIPTGGRQVHDANIVATMLSADIDQLLTFNPHDFARFTGLITVVTPASPAAQN